MKTRTHDGLNYSLISKKLMLLQRGRAETGVTSGNSVCVFSTILLGYQGKWYQGKWSLVALSDTHFCILSRDCLNLSREYFSLWAIKTSLDRSASAVFDPEMLFSRVARHLACLAFCKLQVGIF